MSNQNKLTLSIHNTFNLRFSHEHNFESILNEFLPNLRQFDYTMIHRITTEELIKDFVR